MIELLVAVSIFAIVLAAINTVFFASIRLRQKTSDLVDASLPVQRASDLLERDLENIVQTGTLAGAFCSDTIVSGLSQPVTLEIFTASGSLRDDGPWGEVQKIDYWLQAPTNTEGAGGRDLIRGITRNLLAPNPLMPEAQPILQHVQKLKFSYYDGTNWNESWNSILMCSNTPAAVKLRVDFYAARGGGAAAPPLQLVIPILPPPGTNATAQTTP